MANFDFITDQELRRSLEADFRELDLCYEANAWKSVHVLAGSIIEATLIDYLVSANKLEPSKANGKDLGQLIELCKTSAILSDKAVQLSSIVRSYRNLIHPGRLLRLAEKVDAHGAAIAKAVVEIVVEEVSKKKRESYGYTAEQVLRKIRQDSSALSIAEHLLRETNGTELKRLLLNVLPTVYLPLCESDVFEDHLDAGALQQLFRLGMQMADDPLKCAVGAEYVRILKEEPETVVRNYEIGLFRATDMAYIDPKARPLVIDHMIGTVKLGIAAGVADAVRGIGEYLDDQQLVTFLRALASVLATAKAKDLEDHAAMQVFRSEWLSEGGARIGRIETALERFQKEYEYNTQMVKVIEAMIKSADIPF